MQLIKQSDNKSNRSKVAAMLIAEGGMLAGAWLLAQRRRKMVTVPRLKRAIEAAEDERRRIARELHDDIGQRLSLIAMQLSGLSGPLRKEDVGFERELADARSGLDGVIADVHDLSHALLPSTLKYLGFAEAVGELSESIARRHSLKIELRFERLPIDPDADVALSFYRIAQEALTNVIRHSGSSWAEVRVCERNRVLRMEIVDGGKGFNAADVQSGLGLGTMKERGAAIGGRVSVRSALGRGTSVSVEAPLQLQRLERDAELMMRSADGW